MPGSDAPAGRRWRSRPRPPWRGVRCASVDGSWPRSATAVRPRERSLTPPCLRAWPSVPIQAGGGVGGGLVGAFVDRAREAGRPVTYCSTDVAGNDRVLEFYRRQGFHEAERVRRPEGREMAILIRDPGDDGDAGETADVVAADRDPGIDRQ